jgi:hypothetical protein
MLSTVDYGSADVQNAIVIMPLKYNRMWGADYLLMDSSSFMGGTGGADYDEVIDMFQKIWNIQNYRLFSGF